MLGVFESVLQLRSKVSGMVAGDLRFLLQSRSVTACGTFSIFLFLASLTQDCFYIDRPDDPRAWANGFGLLLVGWLGVLTGIYSWLANPTLLIAWLAMWSPAHRRYAIGSASIALLMMLSFLFHQDIMSDEAGNRSRITHYGPGYWLWIGSAVLALSASCFQSRNTDRFELPHGRLPLGDFVDE